MARYSLATVAEAATGYLVARSLLRAARYMSPRGKTVLITGGTRGLGLLIAREFATRGAKVVVCGRNESELFAVRSEFAWKRADFLAVPCDVTDEGQVRSMVEHVVAECDSLDILVNNAGVISVGPLETMTLDDFREAMAVHFWAPVYTTMAALPHMRRAGQGRIVNISSIGGKIAVPHLLPYCASKFALLGLSEGLRAELAKDRILVTSVCPGLMRTGSPRHAFFKGKTREEYTWFVLGDSLPGLSMSAQRAAAKIVSACLHGDAEVVLSVQAKAAVFLHDLFPGLIADANALVNMLLPATDGPSTQRVEGKDVETPLTRSRLTTLTRQAERANNELVS